MPNEKEYVKPFAQLIPLANDAVNASGEGGQDDDELPILNRKGSKN